MVLHLPSNKIFKSKSHIIYFLGKEAYNKALKNGDLLFITVKDKSDLII